MWGTRPDPRRHDPDDRFIPTHVGNTYFHTRHSSIMTVHPHACGEHVLKRFCVALVTGSSPRMWGTHRGVRRHPRVSRFIPTHVGNTTQITKSQRKVPVHPHACGEHSYCFCIFSFITGSSPRMWGTHNMSYIFHLHTRFIPTHVGNTRLFSGR